MKKRLALILIWILMLTACSSQTQPPVTEDVKEEIENIHSDNIIETLELTDSELAYLESLKERGVLKVASREVETVLKSNEGVRSGFHYETIRRFTDSLGIELDIQVVDNIESFFKKGGQFNEAVKTDETIKYTPDLFDQVDVYVDTLTQIPWREKLMDFIGFIPIRELVVHKSDMEIESIYDLKHLRVAVQSASSYMSTLTELSDKYGLELDYIYTSTIYDSLSEVNTGSADFTIMDSNRVFLEAKKLPNIEVGIPVTEVKFVGWAVSKQNKALSSILKKYVDAIIDEGVINELWLVDYEISFYEYYTLILKDASVLAAMNLTNDELRHLDTIRDRGKVVIAMQNNAVGYNPDEVEKSGFNYYLAKDFAKMLSVDLEVYIVDQFSMYFWENGETPEAIKTDGTYFYVPDLFEVVDIYGDNLTHLPWRQQILNQIEGVPVSTVIAQKSNSGIKRLEDLDGLTVAVMKDSSYEGVLSDLIDTYDIDVNVHTVYSDLESYESITENKADVAIIDSDMGILLLKDFSNIEIVLQASDTDFVGWAVKKDDVVMASILEKYFKVMKENGRFDAYWEANYGVSYPEYMRLLTD